MKEPTQKTIRKFFGFRTGDIENYGSSIKLTASIWSVCPNVLSGVVAAIRKID